MKRSSVQRLLHTMMLLTLLLLIPPDDLSSAQSVTKIWTVAWSPDGTILAKGGYVSDMTGIWLYDANGELIKQLDTPGNVLSITWSPDGTHIAAHTGPGQFTIINVKLELIIVNIEQIQATEDFFVYWSPDGNQIATVGGRNVFVRDAATGNILSTLISPGSVADAVLSVAWSLDGTQLFTVSLDDVVRVWDVATATVIQEFPQEPGVTSMDMSPDGTRLAIGNHNGQVRIIDAETGERLSTLPGTFTTEGGSQIMYVQWHPDGNRLAGASFDRITIWDTSTGQTLNVLTQVENSVPQAMDYSPDGQLAYVGEGATIVITPAGEDGDDDQTIIDATASSPTPSRAVPQSNSVWQVAWHPTEDVLAIAFDPTPDDQGIDDQTAWLYTTGGQAIAQLPIPSQNFIKDMKWSSSGNFLAIVSSHVGVNSVYIINSQDTNKPQLVPNFPIGHPTSRDVAWSPDETHIAINWGGIVEIWQVATGTKTMTLDARPERSSISELAWSMDGKLADAGSEEVYIWDINAPTSPLAIIPFDITSIFDIVWSPDATRIAIGNVGFIAIWDVNPANSSIPVQIATLPLDDVGTNILQLEWRGNHLAGLADFGKVYLWDSITWQKVTTFEGMRFTVALDLSPDGTQIAYANLDGSLTIKTFPTANAGPDQTVAGGQNGAKWLARMNVGRKRR